MKKCRLGIIAVTRSANEACVTLAEGHDDGAKRVTLAMACREMNVYHFQEALVAWGPA